MDGEKSSPVGSRAFQALLKELANLLPTVGYGRFAGLEPGPIKQGLLFEGAPPRTVLFPYRNQASLPNSLEYWYEKILAGGGIYNVGEAYTPTMDERLASMPPSRIEPDRNSEFNFAQNVAYDTSRIRNELAITRSYQKKRLS